MGGFGVDGVVGDRVAAVVIDQVDLDRLAAGVLRMRVLGVQRPLVAPLAGASTTDWERLSGGLQSRRWPGGPRSEHADGGREPLATDTNCIRVNIHRLQNDAVDGRSLQFRSLQSRSGSSPVRGDPTWRWSKRRSQRLQFGSFTGLLIMKMMIK